MDMNANDGIAANREYKDRLFTFIFGKEENRPYLLQLYNALNGTSYTDPSELEITTLQDVIYIRQKNDISFLLDSELSLYEQQSSYNPNMPLRGLMYFSALYRQFLSRQGTDLYSSSLVKIPSPRYVVFYNGLRELPDVSKLRLSDAFEIPNESGEFEWTATVYNVNAGAEFRHYGELRSACSIRGLHSVGTGEQRNDAGQGRGRRRPFGKPLHRII